jgi:hypothetical protein
VHSIVAFDEKVTTQLASPIMTLFSSPLSEKGPP